MPEKPNNQEKMAFLVSETGMTGTAKK